MSKCENCGKDLDENEIMVRQEVCDYCKGRLDVTREIEVNGIHCCNNHKTERECPCRLKGIKEVFDKLNNEFKERVKSLGDEP